jgi:hypothetical protein
MTTYYKNSDFAKDLICSSSTVIFNIANTYRDLGEASKRLLGDFRVSVLQLVNFLIDQINSDRVTLTRYIFTERLIDSIVKLIYYELKYMETNRLPTSLALFVEFICVIFSATPFNDDHSRRLDRLQDLGSMYGKVLLLSQFTIVLELEQASRYNCKVGDISPTWARIHKELMDKTMALEIPTMVQEEFDDIITWIKSAFQVAQNVDFHFTRRHQLQHGGDAAAAVLCKFCPDMDMMGPPTTHQTHLMTFKNWKYQHIYLDFFDNLPALAQHLIQGVKSKNWYYGPTVKLMNIFSMMLTSLPSLTDENKVFMLTVIFLPFLKSFEKCDKMNKSPEFKKLQSSMTHGMKLLSSGLSIDSLFAFKCESIRLIAQLRFNKINSTSMWLRNSFMRLIFTSEKENIQLVFIRHLKDLLITNMELMGVFLGLYQSLRLDKDTTLEMIELRNVLCLHDNDVIVLRTRSSTYEIFCNKCPPISDAFPPTSDRSSESEIEQSLAYATKFKSVIVSTSSMDTNNTKIIINPILLENKSHAFYAAFIKNIPACIEHSKQFEGIFDNYGEELINILFKDNAEEIIMHTNFNMERIILGAQKSKMDAETVRQFFDSLLEKLHLLAIDFGQLSNKTAIQYYIVNIILACGMNVGTASPFKNKDMIPNVERVSLKCFKLLAYFMILRQSEVKSTAVNAMYRMLTHNGMTFTKFLNWYKTPILEHITAVCLSTSIENCTFGQTFNNVSHLKLAV